MAENEGVLDAMGTIVNSLGPRIIQGVAVGADFPDTTGFDRMSELMKVWEYFQTQAEPQSYGIGPQYAPSTAQLQGEPLDPGIWKGQQEAPDVDTSKWLDYSDGGLLPSNWEDFKSDNTTTGGGFFTLQDIFGRQNRPNPYWRDADQPSTNNWRLIGRGPGYIMRNGVVINMHADADSLYGPQGSGAMPGQVAWRSGLPEGVPVAYAASTNSSNVLGWPGGINGWFNTALTGA